MRLILFLVCVLQVFASHAQERKKIKIRPVKEDMTLIVDSLRVRADSLARTISCRDSLIQSLYKIPDTIIVYGNDSLKIALQEDSLNMLNASLLLKDSLISTFESRLCYADTCVVKYAYGLCYEKFDRAKMEEAEQIISRLYQPELKAEMEKDLLVLIKNYEVYYNSLLEILTMAQNDPYRESSVFIDDFKQRYINKIKDTIYYKKHYEQYWRIAYLDNLIDEVLMILESHSRENKSDFTKYL